MNYENAKQLNEFQSQLKQKQYADQCGAVQSAGTYGGDSCSTLEPVSIAQRLKREADAAHQAAAEKERVASILAAHPEFEDFIWILRKGLI